MPGNGVRPTFTLAADVTADAETWTVDAEAPAFLEPPFLATTEPVGEGPEVVRATAIDGTTWTVERGCTAYSAAGQIHVSWHSSAEAGSRPDAQRAHPAGTVIAVGFPDLTPTSGEVNAARMAENARTERQLRRGGRG